MAGNSNLNFAVALYSSDGRLDPSFGLGGRIVTDFGGYVQASDYQDDGKIITAGSIGGSGSDFALARYNNDGSPDIDFGKDGRIVTDFGTRRSFIARGHSA